MDEVMTYRMRLCTMILTSHGIMTTWLKWRYVAKGNKRGISADICGLAHLHVGVARGRAAVELAAGAERVLCEAQTQPEEQAHEQEDDDDACEDAKDVGDDDVGPVAGRVEEAVGVEALSGVRNVRDAEVAGPG